MEEITKTDWLGLYVVPWGTKIIFALVILLIGRWLARRVVEVLKGAMGKAKLDQMLVGFLSNIAYMALLVVVILAALEQLGATPPPPWRCSVPRASPWAWPCRAPYPTSPQAPC